MAMLLVCVPGCAKREAFVALNVPPPEFSESGDASVGNHWWTEFGDQKLNTQITIGLIENYTLEAAQHRLDAARAIARREASDLFPDVNAFGAFDGLIRTNGTNPTTFLLGADLFYPVDLWGEIESRVEAQELRAEAARDDYHDVALALSAEIAATWFSLIEANAQLQLLKEQTASNIDGLKNQEFRFSRGLIRSPDVLRQRQLVDSTREQEVIAQSRIELLRHRLAELQGRPPQTADYSVTETLPELPPLPSTGIPAELVQRRPDVLSALFALQAADRDLASAITQQYPRLNLTASVVTATESAETLFRDWVLSLGSQLIGPVIDGGQRRAEVDRTNAVVRQRLSEYEQVVVTAFREVEDALVREKYQLERIKLLESQLVHARRSSEQLTKQYSVFDVDFLDLLNATITEQGLQREALSARLELILNRIDLYVALAGEINFDPVGLYAECPPEEIGTWLTPPNENQDGSGSKPLDP